MNQLDAGEQFLEWTVVFPLPHFGQGQAFYRVADASGNKRYLSLWAEQGPCLPAALRHEALLTPVNEGVGELGGLRVRYRVSEFVSGETLARRLERQGQLRVYEAKAVVASLLRLVTYLRQQPSAMSLDGLSPASILLGLQDDAVKLLGLPATPAPLYRAPECMAGAAGGEGSEVYVIGVLLYQMLFGQLPWKAAPHSEHNVASLSRLDDERRQPLEIPAHDIFELNETTLQVLRRALAHDARARYASAADMLAALEEQEAPREVAPSEPPPMREEPLPALEEGAADAADPHPRGFAAVAGMRELKAYLTTSVINLLRHTERARRYRIHIPNGMLLYGPPGCGKSFFAEKFAEEVGYSSMYVKASDLASIYVHGSQGKIRELFDEARRKAPTVICFDEFDALAPSRNNSLGAHQYGEVNEFLSQLNNCGQDGIFVIASTNKPDLIDPAVLRRGRIDRVVYLPAPDAEARRELFLLYLRGRPCASGIDARHLACLTEGYVCSDIAGIVNDAAIAAAEGEALITQQSLEGIITSTPPSVSRSTLDSYEQLKRRLEAARH